MLSTGLSAGDREEREKNVPALEALSFCKRNRQRDRTTYDVMSTSDLALRTDKAG